jgi:type IV pilus assembly protein PilV
MTPDLMQTATSRPASPPLQHGFSMLEVLIAVFVISLGLLGLAGLQSVSLKNNASASQRTIATQLAYDMSDRMRANMVSVLTGDYHYGTYKVAGVAGVNTASCVSVTGCTNTQLAQEDVYEWNQQICAQLPQSSACTGAGVGPWGVVCIDSNPQPTDTPAVPGCDGVAGAPYVIKIWWLEDRNDPNLPLKQWITRFQP